MIKENLKIIIKEFHDNQIPESFERHLRVDLEISGSPVNKIVTITGPRRAGKTFYFYQVIRGLLLEGTRVTEIVYINFEDERILPMGAGELHLILDAYLELYPGQIRPYLFFDEIQNIEGWDKFVRRLNEQGHIIFITGSNSRMLSHDIATVLRGRTITYELFPLSFQEFLELKGISPDSGLIYGKYRHEAAWLFNDYLFSGGYPEIVLTEKEAIRGKIIQDYFNTVFYRDLVERYRIKNMELLRQWLKMLIGNIAARISFRKAENDFKSRGMKISGSTLAQFSRYVEDIFFGFFVEMYSESERKRQVNPKKFYLIDQAIFNYLSMSFSENRGRLLENTVFLELRRRGMTVSYFQTKRGNEIDFVALDGEGINLFQVCYDMKQLESAAREKKALFAGMTELNLQTGMVLTMNEKHEVKTQGRTLQILPVWEWLISSGFS